jgi:hypothetical protein
MQEPLNILKTVFYKQGSDFHRPFNLDRKSRNLSKRQYIGPHYQGEGGSCNHDSYFR